MTDQHAELIWTPEGVPVSRRFDDPYFSLANGLAETRHVFLDGNDLPARFGSGFHIAELGFGSGLNMLTAWQAWEEAGQTGPLHFTSFEAFPMEPAAMARAHAQFPEISDLSRQFLDRWQGGACDLGSLRLQVIPGDARDTLPDWSGRADAWFLDGFAPARNPELWGDALMAQVAAHTRPGGTAATYTAAGFVRRGLAAAGFEVTRAPGFGRKRHMTRARLP
ncbi:tRNA U34 5-methylaminomethyl-2-thiouridine-forming methyltransferase MnmC [Cribrihabitans marinus]|uniref:tRNA U34 5-methylaminomethyl-2-thiouridine-forming methyltransferase MnmC n=1 Tax=Cribrihabitans marinus TaxID=1227549 RepID=A0A1H7BTA4_9RHOB|nr:tRNA (5-methylaminomethyl-2-thiouridine)(34)-methyltransferase MnmD [Cribrihabitans marinus]GGH33792.1 FAD-dependent oxidoreductase [Cribrihabitans marinus]SEJ80426.1 tRNA U34 5-methylaminomethyl-2-thiouridine-forming methyltransferase MnmC [Cribrihabitans marinus]